MRHANVRNADEVEVREMIKGRHNMRLRQLGKPAGSIALGATLTEVAPGGISFPRGSAMRASLCGPVTGLRCQPAPSTRIRWSTSQPPNRSSISLYLDDAWGGDCRVSRFRQGRRWRSPIRQARSASAGQRSCAARLRRLNHTAPSGGCCTDNA
jgi:hypothetical protein